MKLPGAFVFATIALSLNACIAAPIDAQPSTQNTILEKRTDGIWNPFKTIKALPIFSPQSAVFEDTNMDKLESTFKTLSPDSLFQAFKTLLSTDALGQSGKVLSMRREDAFAQVLAFQLEMERLAKEIKALREAANGGSGNAPVDESENDDVEIEEPIEDVNSKESTEDVDNEESTEDVDNEEPEKNDTIDEVPSEDESTNEEPAEDDSTNDDGIDNETDNEPIQDAPVTDSTDSEPPSDNEPETDTATQEEPSSQPPFLPFPPQKQLAPPMLGAFRAQLI